MSDLRKDPFTGRWAIVAEGRSARPNDHATPTSSSTGAEDCPFCEGREGRTPPEVAALRGPGSAANGPGWSVRTIPNRFPTLAVEPGAPAPSSGPDVLERRPAAGFHEVIIESPRHAPGMPRLEPEHLQSLFRVFRDRVREVEGRPGISSVILFENWGPESGGTLWHPHAQLLGTGPVPPRLADEQRRFAEGGGGSCLLETVTSAEERTGARLILQDPWLTGVAPYGSEHPYEMRLVPRRHAPSLAAATDAEVASLARHLPAVLRALGQVVPAVSYNWVVHGLGPAAPGTAGFHWHVEVLPRLVRPDGFELGSGLAVNPVPPEEAAARLIAELDPAPGASGRKRP